MYIICAVDADQLLSWRPDTEIRGLQVALVEAAFSRPKAAEDKVEANTANGQHALRSPPALLQSLHRVPPVVHQVPSVFGRRRCRARMKKGLLAPMEGLAGGVRSLAHCAGECALQVSLWNDEGSRREI
ncbi:unnamed protein product [Durusdinium trenchii]|uniref:Uncharacterized protein n=1 Tax=Durusdinium trenchii TaxID=1381693 RepID=A0ABP0K8G2_9DINO